MRTNAENRRKLLEQLITERKTVTDHHRKRGLDTDLEHSDKENRRVRMMYDSVDEVVETPSSLPYTGALDAASWEREKRTNFSHSWENVSSFHSDSRHNNQQFNFQLDKRNFESKTQKVEEELLNKEMKEVM